MLKNYLTLAWKVLQRRKVFTAISLFGTSFTLVVLTVAVALFDHTLSPMAPEVNLRSHAGDEPRPHAGRRQHLAEPARATG